MHVSSTVPSAAETALPQPGTAEILKLATDCLENHKAEDIVQIDLAGKSNIADFLLIASGRSQRQVSALADYITKALKENGLKSLSIQGQEQSDWILIDAGDIIIHLFRPEVRTFYALDKMWGAELDERELDEHELAENNELLN